MIASSIPKGPGFAIFAAGITTTGVHSSTCKYTFSTNVAAAGAALSGPRTYSAACGTASDAVIAGSANTNVASTETYNYQTNAVASYASLHKGKYQLAAVSTGRIGLFVGGTLSGYTDVVSVVDKMDFSSDTMSSAKDLYLALTGIAAIGNKTTAVFGGGMTEQQTLVNNTYKVDYATDARSPGQALSTKSMGLATASNGTYGLFACGTMGGIGSVMVNRYDFATGGIAQGTNLSTSKGWVAGTGDATHALFGGGKSSTTATAVAKVDRYEYATGVLSNGTNLNCGRMYHAASSDSHGGL